MPQEVIDIRALQLQNWLANGDITQEQLDEIQRIWEEGDE